MGIFAAIAARLAKKVIENKLNAVVAAVGTGAALTGAASIFDPALLQMIPENIRGYAVLAVVLVMAVKAIHAEITSAIAEYKAQK